MDFYQTNPHTLRKLLAKRQSPCTQTFKQKPLNLTNQPKNKVNFSNKVPYHRKKEDGFSLNLNSLQKRLLNSKRLHSPVISDLEHDTQESTPIKTTQPNNSDSFETIQKKIKISSHESNARRASFDNGSDHSTTCESGSDGTPIIEVIDCLSSPPLSSESSKLVPEVKIDDDDILINIENLKFSRSSSKDSPIVIESDEPLMTCPLNDGKPQEKIKLKCEFRHKLKTPVKESEEVKCTKCEALLGKCQLYARENGGTCLNEKYDNVINFMCHKGHKWNVRYRNFSIDWCPDCVEEKREELRQKCEEERKRREKMEEEFQKKLFEEARRKAMNNNLHHQSGSILEEELAYFRQIDMEAEDIAKKNTNKYMSEKGISNDITYQQTFQVNKVLATPEECLQKYLHSLGTETVKSEFRRLAKILHPDKNKHPDAGKAFQKIHKVYEAVVGRFEGK